MCNPALPATSGFHMPRRLHFSTRCLPASSTCKMLKQRYVLLRSWRPPAQAAWIFSHPVEWAERHFRGASRLVPIEVVKDFLPELISQRDVWTFPSSWSHREIRVPVDGVICNISASSPVAVQDFLNAESKLAGYVDSQQRLMQQGRHVAKWMFKASCIPDLHWKSAWCQSDKLRPWARSV